MKNKNNNAHVSQPYGSKDYESSCSHLWFDSRNHLLEFNGQILPQNLAATKSSIRNNKILDKRRDNKEPANSKNKFPPTVWLETTSEAPNTDSKPLRR